MTMFYHFDAVLTSL